MPLHYVIEEEKNPLNIDKASNRYYTYWELIRSTLKLYFNDIKRGKKVIVKPRVEFRLTDNADLFIGDDSIIESNSKITMTKPNPKIYIGKNVLIGWGSVITCKNEIVIGDFTRLGSYIYITDHAHSYELDDMFAFQPAIIQKTVIGKDVDIGTGSIILPGVTIGDGAIIGANSVVNKDVEANTYAAGSPARVIKKRK